MSARAAAFAVAALVLAAPAAAAPPAAHATNGAPDFSSCEKRYALVGLPRMVSDGSDAGPIELCRTGYALAFNPDTRTPDWVIERLPLDWLSGGAKRRNNFHADAEADALIPGKGPQNSDYSRSGFDKGHQAPAGDFKSSQPMTDESFLLTNMAPQVGVGFNHNIWKQLETDVRGWILCGGRPELYVITGPVFEDGDARWLKGKSRVRIPDAFFKVIYDPKNRRALGMLLPNRKLDTADLPDYATPIADIEEQTGIKFFPALSRREQNVLKQSAGTLWGSDDSCDKDVGD
ncbi:MAG TPA: DNA/RNA non-specific endonuclease [Rhizomicrobium sp.]|nr:DNA/RNA non-specific endonuclease [Rhizomicrobium sp.]